MITRTIMSSISEKPRARRACTIEDPPWMFPGFIKVPPQYPQMARYGQNRGMSGSSGAMNGPPPLPECDKSPVFRSSAGRFRRGAALVRKLPRQAEYDVLRDAFERLPA